MLLFMTYLLFADHKQSASRVCSDHHERLRQSPEHGESGEFTAAPTSERFKVATLKVSKHGLIRLAGTCSGNVAMETEVRR